VVAGPPLFLGSLPARQPEQFYALLPMRPASLSKVRRDADPGGFADNDHRWKTLC
jgi:hypothetical protein